MNNCDTNNHSTTGGRWWNKQQAVIYNRYLKTAGGGERSSLEFARALEDLGFAITFITDIGSNIEVNTLASSFGIKPHTPWSIVELEGEQELTRFCRSLPASVFVNHTYSSYLSSPIQHGLYALMFPHHIAPEQLECMRSYRAIFCNSPYSELYAQVRWDQDLPLLVAPPPISSQHFQKSLQKPCKEKLVLNVGRFNVDGHSKCQREAIDAFLALQEQGVLDDEWRMLVVGHVNEGVNNEEYFNECANRAPDRVIVKRDASFSELTSYYQRATALWQFTGIGLPRGIIPERCEHLGLVALDALCYGTIPVVYERSGAAMLMTWGDSIYTFLNQDDLALCMSWIAKDFATKRHELQIRRLALEAQKYSYECFRARVEMSLLQ